MAETASEWADRKIKRIINREKALLLLFFFFLLCSNFVRPFKKTIFKVKNEEKKFNQVWERHKLQLRNPESVNAGGTEGLLEGLLEHLLEGLLEGLLPWHCATQSYVASLYHILQLMNPWRDPQAWGSRVTAAKDGEGCTEMMKPGRNGEGSGGNPARCQSPLCPA